MGNGIFNQALGRANEFAERVNNNDPANSALIIRLWEGSITDGELRDLDHYAAIEGSVLAVSAATNYADKVLTDAGIGATVVDDAADTRTFDIADQTWVALGPGNLITRMTVGYDADTTGGTDADIIATSFHDFGTTGTTPNGGDVTATTSTVLWTATGV